MGVSRGLTDKQYHDMSQEMQKKWQPLDSSLLEQIRDIFVQVYPQGEYGDLSEKVSQYWISKLEQTWEEKSDVIKKADLQYDPDDILSRIQQKTALITYADSVQNVDESHLRTLDSFFQRNFPSVQGMHMLPACEIVEDRFNDGYFSQVVRNSTYKGFGSNGELSDLMEKYYSMSDFVMNHVDINNPKFQAYLSGDDVAGECFYVFSEEEYQRHAKQGDFEKIFRPRPFPLFSIFRRSASNEKCRDLSVDEKIDVMREKFIQNDLVDLPHVVVGMMYVFDKVKNDQMLLSDEYIYVEQFRKYLQEASVNLDDVFAISTTQETEHIPYIFQESIDSLEDLLGLIDVDTIGDYVDIYRAQDVEIFGERIRALTTFSHVQVDLNTSTFEGMKMLADDFSWYLSMDLNMIRLDAANFAFKKWGTESFGLPEVKKLLKVVYLSMEAVAPRIVPNLEVNDRLGSVLEQMSDKETAPPMMYDFHLACILPVVFNTGDANILPRIFELIDKYDVARENIRFSLAESHDGKSVRGSLEILTDEERQGLVDMVVANGGHVKYKSGPNGQEPYELCISTRDSLVKLENADLEVSRYLSFYTLAFALMGRNVKSIYINDLFGMSNDDVRVKKTGELRDIKRTKSQQVDLEGMMDDAQSIEGRIAKGMNHLIGIVDAEKAMHFRGNEASVDVVGSSVALVHEQCGDDHALIMVNTGSEAQEIEVQVSRYGLGESGSVNDRICDKSIKVSDGVLKLKIGSYGRAWLVNEMM